MEEAESRFRASVQKIRESEIQRVKLNEKLQETARKLARASGKDVRVSQSSKTHYGNGGSKREYEDDRNSSHGGSSSAEMFATGCLCAYYLYCFYDVEDPFKFDRKMATLVPLFWVACLAVNSNGVNKLATVANLDFDRVFWRFGIYESKNDDAMNTRSDDSILYSTLNQLHLLLLLLYI